ncbi:hypothetical protein [Paenibacillus sp. sptzw28]|nr:hypothetical protein [Paenibacillus sp. sptzw28]
MRIPPFGVQMNKVVYEDRRADETSMFRPRFDERPLPGGGL